MKEERVKGTVCTVECKSMRSVNRPLWRLLILRVLSIILCHDSVYQSDKYLIHFHKYGMVCTTSTCLFI